MRRKLLIVLVIVAVSFVCYLAHRVVASRHVDAVIRMEPPVSAQ